MADDEPDRIHANDQFHRRYWNYTNRPYGGCGCLWMLMMFVLFYLILSLIFTPMRFGYW